MLTVIGAGGFVGRHLLAQLERRGPVHRAQDRYRRPADGELGHVILCAGVTSEFQSRPLDTMNAHVGVLERVLRDRPDAVTVLSSTRLYPPGRPAGEPDPIEVDPSDPARLYDASKLAAESLALASGVPALVLRLANVYGVDPGSTGFLPSVVGAAVRGDTVMLRTALDSTRHYVAVEDVVGALLALIDAGATGIYNVIGPRAVSHREIVERLVALTGCSVDVEPGAPTLAAPAIDAERLRTAIDYDPESVVDALPRLVDGYRRALTDAPS